MRRIIQICLLAAMSIMLTILLGGCGSSNKEGISTGNVARVADEATCRVCHAASIDPVSQRLIVPDYLNSAHYDHEAVAGCEGCHGGGAEHFGVGPIPFPNPLASKRCNVCHTDGTIQVPAIIYVSPDFVGACAPCHTTSGIGGIHAAQVTSTGSCVKCHDVAAPQHGPSLVGDNNGVRAIVPEFKKNSHHIVNAGGADPTDAQCIACHMEGKVVNGIAVVDKTYHMADAMIHLRNGNTTLAGNQTAASGAQYIWNPASPNHTAMDQFCMSCHNSAGATAVAALGLAGQTATNPFGDLISNGYDQMSRASVVAVFEQFATINVAHHAVRGKKYQTRVSDHSSAVTIWRQYSSATSPGSRKTLSEAGMFVTAYTPLGASQSVGDDSTLHCGDCHTVGQWKPGSTTNALGTATTTPIGAHGSANEYLLRNAYGSDALHHQDDVPGATTGQITAQGGNYVCFLCHTIAWYGSSDGLHNNIDGEGSRCNGQDTVGLTGVGVGKRMTTIPGIGNLFGYSCGQCHNAGQQGFGGIHGKNAVYKAYSGLTDATGNSFALVDRKPYRFMGGLSLRYNGGNAPDTGSWERKIVARGGHEGCYNLTTAADNTVSPRNMVRLWGTNSVANANTAGNGSTSSAQNDGTVAGSWGACGHHTGSTTSGSATGPTRTIQRPLSY